ncbi:MAG: hypothetical protein Q8Q09_23975 [Deltaproteobacteria bacterium]|nr:hypothetical protein [Deltaproteobacteria bacterium]
MRLFNREVFVGTAFVTEQFTSADFNSMLGAADSFAIQYVSRRSSGSGSGKVTIRILHSNDNQNWVEYSNWSSSITLGGQLFSEFITPAETTTGIATRGAFVRLGVSVSAGDADLTVIVTGRAL